jgi:transcription elongation factor GreA
MAESVEIRSSFSEALEKPDWERVEELWLEALEEKPIPTRELFEVRRRTWQAGRKNLARTLLELLAESLENSNSPGKALEAIRELIRLAESKPSPLLLERLVANLVTNREGSPSLRAVLDHHSITAARRPLEELETVERWLDHDVGTVVEVIGQGVGRVIDLNLQLENIKVDVSGKRPISVPFGAASRYLRPLPEGDFRRRKVEDPDVLAAFVADQPGEALVQILESLSGPGDVAAIKASLDGVLPTERWTSWWNAAKKHPRVLSSGSGSRLQYDVSRSAEAAGETLLDELQTAEPAKRPSIAKRLAERGPDEAAAAARVLENSLPDLERSQPGIAWMTAGVLAVLPDGADAALACQTRLLEGGSHLALLSGINDRSVRAEALEAIARTGADNWHSVWAEWFLHEESSQNLRSIATRLEGEGHSDALDQAIDAVFRNHANHAAQFIWSCETMTEEGCPESIRARMTPSLLEKLPDGFTRKEFSAFRSRSKALLDGGKVAVRILMESANEQQAVRFSQRIARIDTVEPQRARLIEQAAQHGRQSPADHNAPVLLVASREAADAKQEELRVLIEEEIPKTLKGINAAAAEGDLRENFEYHMLRDRQELQSARAAKIQDELSSVRILEPGAADTSTVNIGTVIHFTDEKGSAMEPMTILGAWDADLERRIFANGSDLAQRLLGCAVDDEVELEEGTATITRIEAWKG